MKAKHFYNNYINKLKIVEDENWYVKNLKNKHIHPKKVFQKIKLICDNFKKEKKDISINKIKEYLSHFETGAGFSGSYLEQNINSKKFLTYIKLRAKEDNFKKDNTHCQVRGCNNKHTHKIGTRVYCLEHYTIKQKMYAQTSKENSNKRKLLAQENANNYYLQNIEKIKKLDLLNKKQVITLIDSFYKEYALLEPRFCILLHDICRLQNGDPVREYPFWLEKHLIYLQPKFADLVDRKFMLAIETKASFHNTGAQRDLPNQMVQYKFFFKGYKVLAVSPDSVQAGTISLYKFLEILIQRRKKVFGK